MTRGEPLGLLIRFALPLVIGNLFQAAYSIVDRVVVGQFVGSDAFSAVGATYAPSNMFASICIGMSTGAGVVVAQYFGAGKKEGVAKAIANSAYISLALAVITSVAGIVAAEPFLNLLNTPEELMDDAVSYMRIYLGGLIAVSAYYTPFSIIRALGDSRTPLIFLVACSLLNIVLDIILVVPFGMGVKGAAIATILAQSISAISCIVYATVKIEYVRLAFQYGKPDRGLIDKTIRIGLPTAVQYALMYLSTVIMQSVVNGFGSVIIGAYTAVSQMEILVLEVYATGKGYADLIMIPRRNV
ncbi:MAG: MATE family efflux transporter, partial [Candidatus Cryptobacteroides sp.]